jgi:hypothetical protein
MRGTNWFLKYSSMRVVFKWLIYTDIAYLSNSTNYGSWEINLSLSTGISNIIWD